MTEHRWPESPTTYMQGESHSEKKRCRRGRTGDGNNCASYGYRSRSSSLLTLVGSRYSGTSYSKRKENTGLNKVELEQSTEVGTGDIVKTLHRRQGLYFSPFTLKKESQDRKDRRNREAEQESASQLRENEGKKTHFVHVSVDGKPYGHGIFVWNDALCKVVRGLDPSYIDIRQQPYHLMETLMKRMSEDFEYSDDINPSWLRTRIGNALSSYRHDLMKLIDAGEECPSWVKHDVWEKLVKIHGSLQFKQKSEQMRYANSCRKRKGRTGPIGVVGIVERLRLKFSREPDEDEVEVEVVRDKGYSGRTKSKPSTTCLKWGSLEQKGSSDNYRDSTTRPPPVTGGEQSEGHIQMNSCQEKSGLGEREAVPAENRSGRTICGDRADDILSPMDNCEPRSMSELDPTTSHPLCKIIMKQVEEVRLGPFGDSPEGHMIVESLLKQLTVLKMQIATQIPSEHFSESAATNNTICILKTPDEVRGVECTGGVEEAVHVME